MDKKIYFELASGDIVDSFEVAKSVNIVLGRKIDYSDLNEVENASLFCAGIVNKIENPTVEMFLERGLYVQAVKLYYLLHPGTSLVDAKDIVKTMMSD